MLSLQTDLHFLLPFIDRAVCPPILQLFFLYLIMHSRECTPNEFSIPQLEIALQSPAFEFVEFALQFEFSKDVLHLLTCRALGIDQLLSEDLLCLLRSRIHDHGIRVAHVDMESMFYHHPTIMQQSAPCILESCEPDHEAELRLRYRIDPQSILIILTILAEDP